MADTCLNASGLCVASKLHLLILKNVKSIEPNIVWNFIICWGSLVSPSWDFLFEKHTQITYVGNVVFISVIFEDPMLFTV